MLTEVLDVVLRVAGAVGVPGIVIYFLRERRKAKADAVVAERTVGSQVSKADSGALEAHVLAVESAFRAERESKDRVIAGLRAEMAEVERRCNERLAEKDGIIADLRTQVGTLTETVERLRRQVETA